MKNTSKPYSVEKFPRIRKATVDLLRAARRKNMIHSVVEVDITGVRQRLRRLKNETGRFASLTGYIVYCTARAVDQNKHMHAYRKGGNRLVLYDEVDVSTTIERKVEGEPQVVAMIVRAANQKSVTDISEEIRDEKAKEAKEAEIYGSIRLFLAIPAFIRQGIFRLLDRSPRLMKKRAGTIMVTSANLIGNGAFWGIPIASHTLNVTIGGIVDRITEVNGIYEKRQHLCLTLSVDHDIVDGAPAARFIRHLKKIIVKGAMETPGHKGLS